MRCPFCEASDTRVVDSRLVSDAAQVRRRRLCTACEERFTTYESAELTLPRVVKASGVREPFSDAKLRASFAKALEKRPVGVERVEAAVARTRRRCLVAGEREVDSRRIGGWVMDELRELDEVAYIRFASVYRRFEDVEAFRQAIETLERGPGEGASANQLSLLGEHEAGAEAGAAPASRPVVERRREPRGPVGGS